MATTSTCGPLPSYAEAYTDLDEFDFDAFLEPSNEPPSDAAYADFMTEHMMTEGQGFVCHHLDRPSQTPLPSMLDNDIDFLTNLDPSPTPREMQDLISFEPVSDYYDGFEREQQTYTGLTSPFSFDLPSTTPPTITDPFTFMTSFPAGTATLSYPSTHTTTATIRNINLDPIRQTSPLLALAFEPSLSDRPHLHLSTLDTNTAPPFLHFLYTRSYEDPTFTGRVPTSVLLHCKLFHLATIYALPDLQTQAYVNILRQCEYACSSPKKPIELCGALRFIYGKMDVGQRDGVLDLLLEYCVEQFVVHRLGGDEEFREVLETVDGFGRDLCKMVRDRGFEDEGAQDIIRLPSRSIDRRAKDAALLSDERDVVYLYHGEDSPAPSSRERRQVAPEMEELTAGLQRLRHDEEKRVVAESPHHESSAEESDEGFSLVSMRRALRQSDSPVNGGREEEGEDFFIIRASADDGDTVSVGMESHGSEDDALDDPSPNGAARRASAGTEPVPKRVLPLFGVGIRGDDFVRRQRSESGDESDWSIV